MKRLILFGGILIASAATYLAAQSWTGKRERAVPTVCAAEANPFAEDWNRPLRLVSTRGSRRDHVRGSQSLCPQPAEWGPFPSDNDKPAPATAPATMFAEASKPLAKLPELPPTEPIPFGDTPATSKPLNAKQQRFVELSQQKATILKDDQLQKAIAELESEVEGLNATAQLDAVVGTLEEIANKHAATDAAKAARSALAVIQQTRQVTAAVPTLGPTPAGGPALILNPTATQGVLQFGPTFPTPTPAMVPTPVIEPPKRS